MLADVAAEDPEYAKYLAKNGKADEKPELAFHLLFYFDAWHVLHDDRPLGAMGGVGPIPYPTISAFAHDHEIVGKNLVVFRKLIKALDAEYLQWITSNRDNSTSKPARQR